MSELPDTTNGPSLLVFSDDWGRHPSSCQHLVRHLLPRYPVQWVNTIGTRTPKLDISTFRRGWEKLRSWVTRSDASPSTLNPQPSTDRPAVTSPRMWPWFSRTFDRRLNRSLLVRQLRPIVERMPGPVIGVTTLPITADLVGLLPVARWVYYCVDDFSVWPGLDGRTLDRMDADLVRRVDAVVTVSDVLGERVASFGRTSERLTHGIDLKHWKTPSTQDRTSPFASGTDIPVCRWGMSQLSDRQECLSHESKLRNGERACPIRCSREPVALFWGVVDRRMDVEFVRALSAVMDRGSIVLVGPCDDPDPELFAIPRVEHRPAVPYAELPQLAAAADVLVMPYADQPVTRAMQPLKLKEYLATGKPVVARDLPAVREWADALDVASTPEAFATAVAERIACGVPHEQRVARRRLANETWASKATRFEEILLDGIDAEPNRPREYRDVTAVTV